MSILIAKQRRIDHIRSKIGQRLLPDKCRIFPPEVTVSPSGASKTDWVNPINYNGLVDIICRLDVSKQYKTVDVFEQEANASNFDFYTVHDVPLATDYRIQINDEWYEVRKLGNAGEWRETRYALVARLDFSQ